MIYPAFLLLRRLPNLETKQLMIGDLYDVFEKNIEYIDLKLIGFPENYKEVLKENMIKKFSSVTREISYKRMRIFILHEYVSCI